ncbi:MAG: HNH endonuclease [Bacteroidales bacterium]|nr:HNH endonuclease [Bacteroidales bacterium]
MGKHLIRCIEFIHGTFEGLEDTLEREIQESLLVKNKKESPVKSQVHSILRYYSGIILDEAIHTGFEIVSKIGINRNEYIEDIELIFQDSNIYDGEYETLLFLSTEGLSKTMNTGQKGWWRNSKTILQIPKYTNDRVWKRDGGKCQRCNSQHNLEVVHSIPYYRGGTNKLKNLILLCVQCKLNNYKMPWMYREWAEPQIRDLLSIKILSISTLYGVLKDILLLINSTQKTLEHLASTLEYVFGESLIDKKIGVRKFEDYESHSLRDFLGIILKDILHLSSGFIYEFGLSREKYYSALGGILNKPDIFDGQFFRHRNIFDKEANNKDDEEQYWWEKYKAVPSISFDGCDKVHKKQGGKCVICGTTETDMRLDYIDPDKEMGLNDLSNIQLICADCINYKGINWLYTNI